MRYGGNCGTAFDPADPTLLATGTCPSCHAAITSSGDLLPASLNSAGRLPAQVAGAAAGDPITDPMTLPPTPHLHSHPLPPPPLPLPAWPTLAGEPRRPLARRAPRPRIVFVLGGLLLLLGAAVLTSADWHLLDPTRPPAGVGGHTPGGALTPPGTTLAATAIASVSSVAPDATPTGGPRATATATLPPSTQPDLLVMPTRILLGLCNSATVRFGVKNSGGGELRWAATASNPLYRLFPMNGTLTGGQQQTVTVSNITSSGQITVAAPGAANTPQRVMIICGVIVAG